MLRDRPIKTGQKRNVNKVKIQENRDRPIKIGKKKQIKDLGPKETDQYRPIKTGQKRQVHKNK